MKRVADRFSSIVGVMRSLERESILVGRLVLH
jgi:hypothetical protein